MLKDTVEEIRRIGMALHPSTLDDLGVAATVEWFCRQFQYTYKHIRIDRTVDIDEHNLSESLKVAIYRIIQEALNNVATHSGGNHVHLGLMQRNHVVELTVDDNGKGFNLEKLGSENNTKVSFGIVGMKERVEVSGGSFAIESVLNRGTKISVRWLL
jgi:signal transduction histidine kinase